MSTRSHARTHSGAELRMRLLAALLIAAIPLGCTCKGSSSQPSAPTTQASTSTTADGGPAPLVLPLSAEELRPSFRIIAMEGELPERLVISFARDVVNEDGVNTLLPRGTMLRIEPAVAGIGEFTDTSTLVFMPEKSFDYETTYTVTLDAVETKEGILKAPQPKAWSHSFTTPRFALLRMLPSQLGAQGQLSADLVFSGPVKPEQVKTHASFKLDDQAVTGVKFAAGNASNVVRATLTSKTPFSDKKLHLSLKKGVPSASGTRNAEAATTSFKVPEGPQLIITSTSLSEGASGFYVDIACADIAGSGTDTTVYREEEESEEEDSEESEEEESYQSYNPSRQRRCILDEEAALASIHFSPPVKFNVTPARNGFRLLGDFKRGTYRMVIDAGARSVDGGLLYTPYQTTFRASQRAPRLRFASTGRYLPRKAWRNLPIQHLNLDSISLSVRNVPVENLVFWMSESREATHERNSNLLLNTSLPLRGEPDALSTTWVDVANLLPKGTRGLLELQVSGGGQSTSARILLTDMSLVAKRGSANPNEVRIWALDIESGEPLSGVEVSLIRKSGYAVARCETDGDDGCILTRPENDPDPSQPFALLARKDEDITYLKYEELKNEIADSDVQGEPYVATRPYRAFAYTDRGVYRPGDTAHLSAIIRGRDMVAPEAGLPVEVRLTDPRTQVVRKTTVEANEAGMVSLDHTFASFAETGVYQAHIVVADSVVGQVSFNVEEFVPERMKVSISSGKPGYSLNETAQVTVEAKYLFGGTPDGNDVQLTCRVDPWFFKPKDNAQYQYTVWHRTGQAPKSMTLGQVHGSLDKQGQAKLECPALEDNAGFHQTARLVVGAAVTEAGSGRTTQGEESIPIHPEKYYLGLRSATQRVAPGKSLSVEGVVVDWNGALAPAATQEVQVEYVRLETEYGYTYDPDSGEERYQRYLRPVVDGKQTVPVKNGRFTLTPTPSASCAAFLVRVRSGGAQTDLQLQGDADGYYWSYSDSRVDQTPRPVRPTALPIELPKLAKVGESITVKVKTPYAGSLLLTAETDEVLDTEWKQVKAGEVTWTFELKKFVPNVYVSGFLVKDPHLESDKSFLPDRAFGIESVTVEPTEYTQQVALKVPEEVRSNSPLTVELDLGKLEGPTFATVAVVDEGILSLTKFPTPNPMPTLFTRRALGVDTYETIGWTLLMPPSDASRSTGGDEEQPGEEEDDGGPGGAPGRVQPVKPVALWSGLVPVPASGKATVTFAIPQYRGAVRVMAMTAGPKRLGRASKTVLVRDPLVLQATLPRFLTQGDEIQIPVFVTNLSGGPLDVKVALSAENLAVPGADELLKSGSPLEMLGKTDGSVKLENGKGGTLVFQARALRATGAAKLRVVAKAGPYESREELDVPMLPSGPRMRTVKRLELANGTVDLKPHLEGWMPQSESSTFWVSAHPYGDSFDHLKYLVRYPFGCIEQTTSSTRPLLFVSDMLGNVDPTLVAQAKIEDMVMHGVNRVLSMQTPSGGFAYWPGGYSPHDWGTAYATHMLLDARKLGYPVPEERLESALQWIASRADEGPSTCPESSSEESEDGESEPVECEVDEHAGETQPYFHYVLALAGKANKAKVEQLLKDLPKDPSGEQAEHAYMLKAALHLAGDHRYEKALRNPEAEVGPAARKTGGSFYSDQRRVGFMLSTFQDLFGNDPAGEKLAESVAEGLREHQAEYYSTQELVWGLTGLGKRVKGHVGDFKSASLLVDGKALTPKVQAKEDKGGDKSWALVRASEQKSLALKLDGMGKGKAYLTLSSQGVRAEADYPTGGEGLEITRTYRNLAGDELDVQNKPLNLADLVFVEITLSNKSGEDVANIALVDQLPSGWEIENPRLNRGPKIDWAWKNLWAADYMNLRDDRIELFGNLAAGQTKRVVYAVRAVTAGKFTLPPVQAEAMYDPGIWAREEGGTVQVAGPWKDYLL